MNDDSTSRQTLPPARSVFLPKEHGSWSLALEPVLLGMLVAPTMAGAGLAVAAVSGLFSRRPLKLSLAPGDPFRRSGARAALGLLSLLAAAGILEALAMGGYRALWPLLPAGVAAFFFLYFDLRGDSRESAAEIAGAATFSFLPAAFATLAGWHAPQALALAAVMLARSVPTVMAVRTYLHLGKGQQAGIAAPIGSALVAFLGIALLAATHLVSWWGCVLSAALLVRAMVLLTVLRGAWSARRVGFTEAAVGLGYILVITVAYWR